MQKITILRSLMKFSGDFAVFNEAILFLSLSKKQNCFKNVAYDSKMNRLDEPNLVFEKRKLTRPRYVPE